MAGKKRRKATANSDAVEAKGDGPAKKTRVAANSAEEATNTNVSVAGSDSLQGVPWILGNGTSVDAFRKQHFERKPLHVKRGVSDYYSKSLGDLATPEALFALMDEGVVPVYRINMFRCVDGSTKETPQPPPADVADVRKLFKQGWSIQWLQPQQEHDALASLVAVLESQFGSLVGVNAYITAPGAQGLAPHWDDVEVFVLQLGGQKTWDLYSHSNAVPLPPASQTLPRYSSGDLPLDSLPPAILSPDLSPGDFLYFPRGTIHHAVVDKKRKVPSVHLTISTYQQQSVYDLANKTFEEVMARAWENDETIRRGLPWRAFAIGSQDYPQICASVSTLLRQAADAVDEEAKQAKSASAVFGDDLGEGFQRNVAGALTELSSEFVKHRMPPILELDQVVSSSIVSPTSQVHLMDPTALTLVGAPDEDEEEAGAATLIHCIGNSRHSHMITHPGAGENMSHEAGDNGESEEGEESEEDVCEEGSEGGDSDASGSGDDSVGSGEREGQRLSGDVAAAIRELCRSSRACPMAGAAKDVSKVANTGNLASILLRAKIPEKSWPEVCSLLTQLVALGLVTVGSAPPGGGRDRTPSTKKKAR